ncbi:hypothetical protein [Pedobacter sp. MW01-1-1]|uniref:hypothetical protein n=1 Tax=Pedobacter sp. MW01-1-1 TaxID=3383027 RepID=UPI003FEDF1E5
MHEISVTFLLDLKRLIFFTSFVAVNKKAQISLIWLLLLVFSALQILPSIHFHSHSSAKKYVSLEKSSAKQLLTEDENDCSICDFVIHKHIEFQETPSPIMVTCFATKEVKMITGYQQQLFERAVHTWTNKGPPVIS